MVKIDFPAIRADAAQQVQDIMQRIRQQREPATDQDYDIVPDMARQAKKGVQCGRCGMKFDYGKAYGYACGSSGCPMGMGGVTC